MTAMMMLVVSLEKFRLHGAAAHTQIADKQRTQNGAQRCEFASSATGMPSNPRVSTLFQHRTGRCRPGSKAASDAGKRARDHHGEARCCGWR